MAIGEAVEVSRDAQKAAVETIELYRNDQEMVVDAFDRVVVDLFMDSQANGHKTFMICSCNAGVGSTSIAMELAISLSVAGWRTVLIDGDLRKEAQYKKHHMKVKAGLSDFIVQPLELEDILYPTNWPGLHYVACGHQNGETPVKLLCSQRMGELMDRLKESYDFILFDCPALNSVVDAAIVGSKTDSTFLVAASGDTKFRDLETAKKQLEEAGANILGVILNKVTMDDYRYYMEDYNYFSDKEYLKRSRYFRQETEERPKRRKSIAALFKRLIVCLAMIVSLMAGALRPVEAEAASERRNTGSEVPVVAVEGYDIDGVLAPGKEFTLSLSVKNMDASEDANQLRVGIYMPNGELYPADGETNQRYVDQLEPGETYDCEFALKARDSISSEVVAIQIDISYMSAAGGGTNTVLISPPVSKDSEVEIISILTPERAVIGARALFSIQYENNGTAELHDLKMQIQGNIVSTNEEVSLKAPRPGRQEYAERSVIFTDIGSQRLTVYISYEDENGKVHQLEPRYVTTEVINSSSDGSVYGTNIAWDENNRHLVERDSVTDVMKKLQSDYEPVIWAAAGLLLADCLWRIYKHSRAHKAERRGEK